MMGSATGRTRIGVDTGGTFTDVVALREGRLWSTKVSSTPPAFEQAVLKGVEAVCGGERFDLFHSTTVATNALLERKGARTALITTAGFRDLLTIGRQNRPFLYDLFPCPAPSLVPRDHCFEVPERVSAEGEVLLPLDTDALEEVIGRLRALEVESVAVVFLFSFLFPDHERAAGELLERAGFSVSLSHRILPEFREVERASTTVVNAFVRPVMETYLGKVQTGAADLGEEGLQIIKSNGGCLRPHQAGREAVQTVLSGPAAGVLGAQTAVRAGGHGGSFITFDMGGTSSDVAMVREKAVISREHRLGGFALGVPMVDVHTVGAGGGSIASVDAGGALRVGPESAGASPGPACYGKADRPTVTDAHVVLGHVQPGYFLQGRMELDVERSFTALAELGRQMGGRSAEEAARDVIRLVNVHMESAIRVISVQRGFDPADSLLVGFGGAGGLHVCALAEALNMRRVLFPCHPGVLSALGCVATPLSQEGSRTVMRPWEEVEPWELRRELEEMIRELTGRFQEDGVEEAEVTFGCQLDMRYRGQSFELSVDVELDRLPAAAGDFHALHRQRYGHAEESEALTLVTLRVHGRGPGSEITLPPLPERGPDDPDAEVAPGVVRRDRLRLGDRLPGPLRVVEDFSTLLIPEGWTLTPDRAGNLIAQREVP